MNPHEAVMNPHEAVMNPQAQHAHNATMNAAVCAEALARDWPRNNPACGEIELGTCTHTYMCAL